MKNLSQPFSKLLLTKMYSFETLLKFYFNLLSSALYSRSCFPYHLCLTACMFLGLLFLQVPLQAQSHLASSATYVSVSQGGGAYQTGSIFSVDSEGNGELLHSFYSGPAYPYNNSFVEGPDGMLYGLTRSGGQGTGTLISLDPATGEIVHELNLGSANGGYQAPGSLMIASDGNLYGFGYSVFTYDPVANEASRVSSTANFPHGTPVEGEDGTLYGMTYNRGVNNQGNIFSFDIETGVVTELMDFDGSNGAKPKSSLTYLNGFLYGYTAEGGTENKGVVFKYHIETGVYTKLADLDNSKGSQPTYGRFVVTEDENLIGSFYYGVDGASGAIVGINTTTDEFDTLYSFQEEELIGGRPNYTLSKKPGEDIYYGITNSGGSHDDGVIYEFTLADSSIAVLHHMERAADGKSASALTLVGDVLYGMANTGGSYDVGTVFKYDLDSDTFTKLGDLEGAPGGQTPFDPILVPDGRLFGVTYTGGLVNDGVLYSYDFDTEDFQVEEHFTNVGTGHPRGRLIYAQDTLYGITFTGSETIYGYDISSGVMKELYTLSGTEGSTIYAGLSFNADSSAVYGTTHGGGANGKGVLFKYELATSTYSILHHFDDATDGERGEGYLLLASDGKFYGMNRTGGNFGAGVLFSFDPADDTFETLIHFQPPGPAYSTSSLIEAEDGILYGTTIGGGDNNYGTLFRYEIATNEATVLFSGSTTENLRTIYSTPILSPDQNHIYVSIYTGGASNDGAIVDYDLKSESYSVLYDFDGTIGVGARQSFVVKDVELYIDFPDENFEAALLAHDPVIDSNSDGKITPAEAEAFTGTMDVNSKEITSLEGIEFFTQITKLYFNDNDVTELDLSANLELVTVSGFNNELTSIDVSGLSQLTWLNVTNSSLTSIDLSDLIELRDLYLAGNDLTSIDLSSNTKLRLIGIQNNQLESLDLSTLTTLNALYADGNGLTSLDVSANTGLSNLFLANNSLTTLDLSTNTLLTYLKVDGNELTELDLTTQTQLEKLYVDGNALESLDLTNGNNTAITEFDATDNPDLLCITVDDPAYSETNWTNVDEGTGFSTDCDVVYIPDDNFRAYLLADTDINTNEDGFVQSSEASTYTGDIVANNLEIADLTGIEAFTQITLLALLGNNLTEVDLSENTLLTTLSLYSNDLTAIDLSALTALESLSLYGNQLTSLDVSANTQLHTLGCHGNALTSLDVSANTLLETLRANDNELTSIDVSSNTMLKALYLGGNSLTTVDLSQNILLEDLNLYSNDLTAIDLTAHTALTALNLGYNEITSLDLSANILLEDVFVFGNSFTELDLSANTSMTRVNFGENTALREVNMKNGVNDQITYFKALSSPVLTCVTVDDIDYSETNWTDISDNLLFSTDCGNTANDILTFSLPEQIAAASIDGTAHQIDVEVPFGTDRSALTPTYTISEGAFSSPVSGVAQDFSEELTITVTAENPNAIQDWKVIVLEENRAPTALTLDNPSITENNEVLAVIGAFETADPNADDDHSYELISGDGDTHNASFEINGEELRALESFDFESQSTYSIRVQSSDGRGGSVTEVFSISVEDVATSITSLALDQTSISENLEVGSLIGNLSTVGVELNGSSDYSLVAGSGSDDNARFQIVDSELQSAETFNFEEGESYSVRIAVTNGSASLEQVFEIQIVDVVEQTGTDILSFELAEQSALAVVDAVAHTVTIQVAFGTDISALLPTITLSAGASIDASGEMDFSEEVTVIVTAEEPTHSQTWTILVSIAPSNETDILSFSFPEQSASALINSEDHSVVIEVVYGSDLTDLLPEITLSEGASISPEGAQDFSAPVTYTVTAADGTTQEWIVTVTEAPSNETDILDVSVAGQLGDELIDIDAHTVSMELAAGSDLSALELVFTLSEGASISPSGALDFSQEVTYTVTAADGTTQDWVVTVIAEPLLSAGTQLAFHLYPNPASDWLQLDGVEGDAQLSFYDINGQEVKSLTLTNEQKISLADLESGMYVIRVSISSLTTTTRLLIQK